MAKYTIKYEDLQRQADSLARIGKAFGLLERKLLSIASAMDVRDSGMAALKSQLRTASGKIPAAQKQLTSAGIAIESIAKTYLTAEKSNYYNIQNAKLWNAESGLHAMAAGLGSLLLNKGLVDTATIGLRTSNSISLLNMTTADGLTVDLLKGSWSLDPSLKYGTYKDTERFKIIEQDDKPFNQYAYDKKSGQMILYPLAPDYAKKGVTLLEGKVEGKVEGTLLGMERTGKTTWGEGTVSAKVGTAEAHAELAGGLYVFDKEGKKKLAPSVSAEVGASVALITASMSGTVGDDLFGGYGGVDLAGGKAEAKASASAALFNEKGQFNVQARAKASAEAVAFEAKGRVGATVLGVDAGVSGSFKVGVGAHAEVGYVDGVVKVDIGASLGIGASVGFEVDVGGAVDAVCTGVKSAWNTVAGWF